MEQYNNKGVMYAAFTAFLWGFLAIALKIALYDISPVTVVWFRFFTAFVILSSWTMLFRRRDFSIFKRPPWLLFLAGFFLGFNYLGFISGIRYVSPSSSQVFIQVGPVSFALAGILIFREHVNWKHLVGLAMVIAGIVLFYSEQISELLGREGEYTKGMLMIFGGGLSWATFASLQKKLVQSYSTNQLNLFIYGMCALIFLPFVSFDKFPDLFPGDWALLTFLGLNTVLAYGSLALAIKYTQAARVSVIITLNPIITFVLMAILTRAEVSWIEPERFTILSIVGAVTVLSGAIMVISAGRMNNRKKIN